MPWSLRIRARFEGTPRSANVVDKEEVAIRWCVSPSRSRRRRERKHVPHRSEGRVRQGGRRQPEVRLGGLVTLILVMRTRNPCFVGVVTSPTRAPEGSPDPARPGAGRPRRAARGPPRQTPGRRRGHPRPTAAGSWCEARARRSSPWSPAGGPRARPAPRARDRHAAPVPPSRRRRRFSWRPAVRPTTGPGTPRGMGTTWCWFRPTSCRPYVLQQDRSCRHQDPGPAPPQISRA